MTKRPSKIARVSNRLTAKLHRIFARAVREEAKSRKVVYRVGPFKLSEVRNPDLAGWHEVADWLEQRAVEYENRANQKKEPRF